MVNFDPEVLWHAALGGTILGIATSLNYIIRGKVTGMSGIVFGIISFNKSQIPQKLSIVGGMFLASALAFLTFGYGKYGGFQPFGPPQRITGWTSALGFCFAGFLVGFGTKLSNGCTSGHGLCGLPRFSIRSLVAVCTFLFTAIGVSTFDYYLGLGPIAGSDAHSHDVPTDHTFHAEVALLLGVLLPILGYFVGHKKQIWDQIVVFIVGVMFAVGLMVSGMSRRENILQFLQINSSWNPALLFVLGCGLIVNTLTFTIMRRKGVSLCGNNVFDPKNADIDWKLVFGAFCFGVGWGVGGLCPGPFIVLSSVFTVPIQVYWGLSMIVGMYMAHLISKATEKQKSK